MLNTASLGRPLLTPLTNPARIATTALRPQITSQPLTGGLRITENGYTRDFMTRPSSTSKFTSSIISFTNLSKSTGQQRSLFTMMSKEEFAKIKGDYERIGIHGTARWAVKSIEANGIDCGLTGKYRGGKSAAGSGLYTTNDGEIAHHYARRAGLGESYEFDLDARPQSFVVYREGQQAGGGESAAGNPGQEGSGRSLSRQESGGRI